MVVGLLERAFALVINNAGTPGIRLDTPIVDVPANTDDPISIRLIDGMKDAAPAIWAVLVETGVAEAMSELQHRACTQLVAEGDTEAAKALKLWPKAEDGSPVFAQPDEPKFIDVCGYKLLDTQPVRPQRPKRKVSF